MPILFRIAAVLAVLIISPRNDLASQELARTPAVSTGDYGAWGYDMTGADFATKPGDDFYRYGNGAWYDRTVIAPDQSDNSIDRVLIDTAEARIRDILEHGGDGVEPSARADAAKIGVFYAAFMDEARAEALDAQPIAPLLQMVRNAASREELAELMGASARTFLSSLFGVGIVVDSKAPDKYVVAISQGGLGLPNRDYYLTPQFADKKAAYLAYMAQMLGLIGWEVPQDSAAAILAFETDIAEVSWTTADQRDSEKTYNPMRVAELEQAAPFPWRRLLQSANLGQLDRVVAEENTALPNIAAIYARTPIETLKAWQALHLADAAAPFLSKRFVTASFEFNDKTLRGVAELPERWKRGVGVVNGAMGEAIGRVYVARYFPAEAKSQIETLVGQLRLAFKARIERIDWMSQDTKIKALDKLARYAEQFKSRAADLGQQYDAFEPYPGVHVNGELTMGENIADLGGALVALDAYRLSLKGAPAPTIDGFSGDQRFFLSFAQSWRRKATEDSIRERLVSNAHAPEQYRVNGVVRNLDAWYEAFGVKAGDELYLAPEKRVRIW
jgi:putative endopeptidase